MFPFQWTEILLYLLPIVMLVAIAKFGRPYLTEGNRVKLAVIDTLHPIVWLCFHYLSLLIFYFSLLPVLLLGVSVSGMFLLFKQYRSDEKIQWVLFWRQMSTINFILAFGGYAILVFLRVGQVLIY